MRLEQIEGRPLNEDEQAYKKAYQAGNHKLWESPMSFAEYENYDALGLIPQSPHGHYYKEKSIDRRGITIDWEEGDSKAMITVHQRYSFPVMHNHDYVEIIYIASGNCVHFLEDTSFEMKTGDVCVLAPNALHALGCTNDESCVLNIMVNRHFFDHRFLNILRGGKLLSNYLEGILYERSVSPYILFPTGTDPWLHTLGQHLLTESNGTLHAYDYSILLLTSEFLLHLVREYEMLAVVPNMQSHSQNDLIVAVLGYLSVNYSRTTLTETADFFGYSTAYLSRMIRDNTGKTFNQIITELQMERAALLLKDGQMNLTEIAQEVGCFDSSHFNKKFKSFYGVSPKQYMV